MSGDLISRNGLVIRLKNGSVIPFSKMILNEKHKQILEFEDMIKTQATAYDVDKVVQQITELQLNVKDKSLEVEDEEYAVMLRGQLRGISDCLEIVKKGGA